MKHLLPKEKERNAMGDIMNSAGSEDKNLPGKRNLKPFMVTIDPGMKATGLVAWDLRGLFTSNNLPSPIYHRTLHSPKAPDEERILSMSERVVQWIVSGGYPPCLIFIEYPLSYPTRGGIAVAHRGKLTHIAYLVGKVDQSLSSLGCMVKMVPATWRGGRSNFQMRLHVQKYLPYPIPNDHIADALGMGIYLWRTGHLKEILEGQDQ